MQQNPVAYFCLEESSWRGKTFSCLSGTLEHNVYSEYLGDEKQVQESQFAPPTTAFVSAVLMVEVSGRVSIASTRLSLI